MSRNLSRKDMPEPEIEIIDNPKLKTFLRNITELGFTSFMWGLWIYLFLPLLNIVLWLLGIRYFYAEVIESTAYAEFLELLGRIGWIILAVFLTLRLWGAYNYWRFKNMDRRRSHPYDTVKELARYFKVPAEQIADLQSCKEVVWPVQQDPKTDLLEWIARAESNSKSPRLQ